MKKNIFICTLILFTCLVFADSKEKLGNITITSDFESFIKTNPNVDKLYRQGEKYFALGEYQKALKCYNDGIVEAQKEYGENSLAEAILKTSISSVYMKKGEIKKAADILCEVADIYQKSPEKTFSQKTLCIVQLNAAYFYYDSNNIQKAYDILVSVEKNIERLPLEERRKMLPKFNRHMVFSCFELKKYKEAIPYLQRSLATAKEQKSSVKELGIINLFLGEAFLELDELEKALAHLKDSEKYLEGYPEEIFFKYRLYLSLSTVYMLLKKYEQNLLYAKKLNETCKLFKKNNFRRVIGLVTLADAYHLLKQEKDAVKLMEEAIKLAKSQNVSQQNLKRLNDTLDEMRKK